jgi:hypothetical protein
MGKVNYKTTFEIRKEYLSHDLPVYLFADVILTRYQITKVAP